MSPREFTHSTDVKDRLVIPALGEYADQHDVDAICAEVSRYDPTTDSVVITVTEEQFWDVVEKHAIDQEGR